MPRNKKNRKPSVIDNDDRIAETASTTGVEEAASKTKQIRQARAKKQRDNLTSQNIVNVAATQNLQRAIEITKEKVARIAKEFRQLNRKFTDSEFNLENIDETLYNAHEFNWGGVIPKRISSFYKGSKFYADGQHPGEISEGTIHDVWFLAAVSICRNIPGLIETICVDRDEEVGVYGFIFFKDGDWISTVVDDKFFVLKNPNGVVAPLLSECKNPMETWLPLLEKAFAKVHGDYESIMQGIVGQGLEDLTGGVYTTFVTSDIMDRDRFWQEELSFVNTDRLFGVQRAPGTTTIANGLLDGFSYSVLQAVEIDGHRLVKVGNPYINRGEWTGAWSDGSEEWTSETMARLNHKFGKDGAFWMSYEDLLYYFSSIGKCRIFDSSWFVHSAWINYNIVPMSNGKFILKLHETEKIIIVLQQPDSHYFYESPQYIYHLSFRVYKQGSKSYLIRSSSTTSPLDNRSINIEIELEAGTYEIIPRIIRTEFKEQAAGHNPRVAQKKQTRIEQLEHGRDANDDSDDENENNQSHNVPQWELKLGLRVYNRREGATVSTYQGPFPSDEQDPSTFEEDQDPETETSTATINGEALE
ncbi:hypothetical protein G9A89_001560 [Geosiphon pyriformis]|nr:hypothetical protein G9A89_001560 [Geosiphon pyriformis]